MAEDANQHIFDESVKRQISVRRYTAAEVAAVLSLLEEADAELVRKLRDRLGKIVGRADGVDFTSVRLKNLLQEVQQARKDIIAELKAKMKDVLPDFARVEADFEEKLLKASIPFEIEIARAGMEALRTIVTAQPFQGQLLGQWFDGLAASDQRALIQAIQLGLAQGEDVDQIVRRVVGTRAASYSDGILSVTRRNAEAVVRTAINHVSNGSREAVWEANSDIILALRWTSVLDNRTSAICQARDGMLAPVGDNPLPSGSPKLIPPDARPPAHVNCRSIMVAVIDPSGIAGVRPAVSEDAIGQVPAATTYGEWLADQSDSFQDDVLGVTKADLFRTGKISLDQFIDRRGNELTLSQLAKQEPSVFRAAGLDPKTF